MYKGDCRLKRLFWKYSFVDKVNVIILFLLHSIMNEVLNMAYCKAITLVELVTKMIMSCELPGALF